MTQTELESRCLTLDLDGLLAEARFWIREVAERHGSDRRDAERRRQVVWYELLQRERAGKLASTAQALWDEARAAVRAARPQVPVESATEFLARRQAAEAGSE